MDKSKRFGSSYYTLVLARMSLCRYYDMILCRHIVIMIGHGGSPTTRSPEQQQQQQQQLLGRERDHRNQTNHNAPGKAAHDGQGLAPGPGRPQGNWAKAPTTTHLPTTTVSSAQQRQDDLHFPRPHHHSNVGGGASPKSVTPANSPDMNSSGYRDHRDILPPR